MGPLEPAYSFLSLTEVSEYSETEDDVRARLQAQGADDVEDRVAKALERLAGQRQDRLHPRLPRRAVLAFYPMSKARDPGANWYRLPFGERRELMHGHGKVGRRYTGRVLQLVTGSTGLDDFEWGVTLLADDLSAIKEVVYDMRFDEVTAAYGRFGPFLVGLTCEPAELPGATGPGLTKGWSCGHQRVVRPPTLAIDSSEPWRGQARGRASGRRRCGRCRRP